MEVRLGLLVLAFIVAEAIAGPVQNSRNTCAEKQCIENSKYTYRPGTTYTYTYAGAVNTRVNGATESRSGMSMEATAQVEVITPCEFALKLTNVRISEIDPQGNTRALLGTELFKRSVEEKPLRFSFQDGRIEEVCPDQNEATWITNIKRGVLSSFQNSMPDLQTPTTQRENDVTGNCPAEYRIAEKSHSSITVDRTKDLLACTDRHGYKTAFQATPYRVASDIQSMPLTRSSHNCRQTFHTSGYLSNVECKETHVFRPFSKENNGATTEATHTLVYQRERPGVSTQMRPNIRRSNLLYEHERDSDSTGQDDSHARTAIRNICGQSAADVRPETPKLFSDLVYKLKNLDKTTLRSLYEAVNSSAVCSNNHQTAQRFFHDAIPMTGTVGSVSLMTHLIKERRIQDGDADMWLTSLAFVQSPKLEMINSVKELLTSPIQNQRNFLSTSALIHNYCRFNANCQNEEAVRQVVQLLETNLRQNCRVPQSRDQDRILMTLKALGNMAVAPQTAATLGRCAQEAANPIEVRLAALDALKQQPCEADRSQALSLFNDKDQEDEVRVAAYLASMKCANAEVVNTVKNVLERETANQVGSFVWTHLTNLMETDDPHKAEISNILNNVFLKKEFDMDRRKYSRNYEGSFFIDSINTGAKMESNVIWSRKSFVPRSAMFNLTVDLFGHSVNLLEVGGRVEGMEQLLETFFGPEGYFPEKQVMKTLRREKRQVANQKLDSVHRTYDGKGNQDNIKGNMYFKIFGNELAYFDLMNLRSGSEFNILDILIKLAQNREVELSKSVMFLDTTIIIPTIVGIPLKLSVNGTATINLGLSGKLDVRRAHPSPRSIDIDGRVRSSAAVQISSLMSVDAFVAQTGLKMVTTLHSSTELDGKLQIQDSKIIVVNVNMPRAKQEIFSMDNKFYIVHQNEHREQAMIQTDRVEEERCTGDDLNKILGLELCGAISYPRANAVRDAPFYPLTGPSRLSIVLNKKDTHSAYQFEAKLLNEKVRVDGVNQYKRTARLAFNTPNSQVDRNLLFDFILDEPQKAIKLQVNSPWKKVGLEGSLVNDAAMKRATLRLNLDENTEYSMRAEIQVDEKPEGKVIYPNINIKMPHRNPIQLNGNIAYKQPSSISFNLRVLELFSSPVKVSGSTTYDAASTRLNTDLKLECPYVDASAEGYFEMSERDQKSRFSMKYKRPQRPEESLTLHYKLRNTKTGSLSKVSVDTSIRNTIYPEYNNKLKLEVQMTGAHAETTLDFQHGHSLNDQQRRLQASVITNYQVARARAEVDATISLSYPLKNLRFTTRLEHKHHARMLTTKATFNYADDKNAEVMLALNNFSAERIKLNSALRVTYPGRDMMYKQAIDERAAGEYHHSLLLQWQQGRAFSTSDVFKRDGHRYSLTSHVNVPDQAPITLKGAINLDKLDGKLTISCEQNERKYAVGAGYTVQLGNSAYRRKFDVQSTLMLETPSRKHSTQLNVNHDVENTNANFNYDWTLNEVSKTISLRTEAKHKLGQAQSELFGSVQLKTPYQPVEDVGARFQYTCRYQQHSAILAVTWAPQTSITTEISGRVLGFTNFDLSAAVNTPFDGYRRISSTLRQRIENEALSLAVNGQFEEHRVDLELSAGWKEKIQGAFKFRLPNVANSVAGKFEHQRVANGHLVSVEATWNDQVYRAVSKAVLNSLRDAEVSLIVSTPINGYQTSEASYKHYLSGQKIEGKLKVAFANKEAKIQVTTENNSDDTRRDLLLNIEVATPFAQLRIGKITLRHADDGARFTSQVAGQYNDMALGYALTANGNHDTKMYQGNVKIDTPFPGYQRIVYSWNHRFQADMMSTNEVQINGLRYLFQMNGNVATDYNGQSVTGQLTLESPHPTVRNVVVNLKYQNSPNKLMTSATLSINGNTAAFSVDATGSRRNRLVCNLNLNLEPILVRYYAYQMKPITAYLTFDGQMRPNSLVSYIRFGENKEIRLESSMDFRGADYITGTVIVNTPFFMFNRVSIQMKHEREGIQMTSELKTTWDNDQFIQLKGAFTHGPNKKGEISVETPFPVFNKFSFTYNHQEEPHNHFVHTNNLLVEFMGQRLMFDSGATYQGKRNVNAFARLTSPFEKFSNLAYQFSTQDTNGERISSFNLELTPGQKSEISMSYKLRPNFDMNLSVKTPYYQLSNLQARFGYTNNFPQVTSHATFDMVILTKPMSGALQFNMQNLGDITARITATNDVLIVFEHKHVGENVNTKLQANVLGRNVFNVENKLFLNRNNPTAELKVLTPFSVSSLMTSVRLNLREWSGSLGVNTIVNSLNHRLELNAFPGTKQGRMTFVFNSDTAGNVDLKLQYYHRVEGSVHKYGLKGTYQNKPVGVEIQVQWQGKYMASLKVNTPIKGHENYEVQGLFEYSANRKLHLLFNLRTPFYLLNGLKFEYEHTGTQRKYQDKTTFEYDASISRIIYSDEWNVDGLTSIQANGRMLTPFKNLEYTRFTINHNLRGDTYATKVEVEYAPGRRAQLESTFSLAQGLLMETVITSPADILRRLALKVDHRGDLKDFTCTSSLSYNDEYSVTTETQVARHMLQSSTARVTCPQTEPVTITFNQAIQSGLFEHNLNIDYSNDKHIKIASNINNKDKLEVNFNVETPYNQMSLMKLNLVLDKASTPITHKLTAEMATSRGRTTLRSNFEAESVLEMSFSAHLNSPYANMRDLSLVYSHRVTDDSKVASLDVGFAPNNVVAARFKLTGLERRTLNLEAKITTPFEKFREGSFVHESINNGENDIERRSVITYNEREVYMFKSRMQGLNNIRIEEKSPIHHIVVSSEKGDDNIRKSVLTVNWQTRVFKTELSYRIVGDKLVSINIETPWKYLTSCSLSLGGVCSSSYGLMKSKVNHNLLAGEIGGTMYWDLRDSVEGKLSFKTPYAGYEDISVDFSQQPELGKNSATVQYMTGKKIEVDFTYAFPPYSAKLKVRTPFQGFESLGIAVTYSKTGRTYTSTAAIEYMTGKIIEANSVYKRQPYSYVLKIKTPIQGFEKLGLEAQYTRSGDRHGANLKVEYKTNKKIEITGSMSPTTKTIRVQTPFRNYENQLLTVDHSGDVNQFNGKLSLEYHNGKKIEATTVFSRQPLSLTLTVKTPYTGYEQLVAEVSHVVTQRNSFKSKASVTYMTGKTLSTELEVESGVARGFAKLNILTPFRGYENLFLVAEFGGWANEFAWNAQAQYMQGKKIEVNATLNSRDKRDIVVLTVKTPFRNWELTTVKTTHQGRRLSAFNSSAEVIYMGGQKIMANIGFNIQSVIRLNAKLTTPYKNMELTSFEFSHDGSKTQFNTVLRAQYLRDQMIESKVTYEVRNSARALIVLTASLKTPYEPMKETKFTYRHEGLIRSDFSCNAALTYGQAQSIGAVLNFRRTPDIGGDLTITTPFRRFETQSLSFAHRGHAQRFTTEAKLKCSCGETGFKVDSTVHGLRRIMTTVNIFTPVRNFESMTVKLTHAGGDGNFKSALTYGDAANRNYLVQAEISARPIAGNFKIVCPMGSIVVTHAGDLSGFTTTATSTFGVKNINVHVAFAGAPNMQLKIESPWADMTLAHNGGRNDFTTSVLATVRGHSVTSEVRFRLQPVFTLTAQLTSPVCTGQVNLNGGLRNFRSTIGGSFRAHEAKAELNWSTDERIAAEIKYSANINQKPYVFATSFSHMFNGRQLTTAANAQWSATQRVSSTLNYKREGSLVSAELKIVTPFQNYRDLSAGVFFNGNQLAFTSGASLQYKDAKKIDLNVDYNHKRQGSITLQSPCPGYPKVGMSFAAAKVSNKDGYTARVYWKDDQAIQIKLSGIMAGDIYRANADGFVELSTPFGDVRNLVVECNHRHNDRELASTFKINYNRDTIFHTIFDLSFTEVMVRGHCTMISPLPLKLSVDLSADDSEKKAEVEFSWDTRSQESKIKVTGLTRKTTSNSRNVRTQTLTLTLPSRTMAINTMHTRAAKNVKCTASFGWDETRNRRVTLETEYKDTSRGQQNKMWEASAKLITPIRTIYTTINHSENGRRYTADGQFSWDFARDEQKKIVIASLAEVSEKNCLFEVAIRPPWTHEIKIRREVKYLTEDTIFWTKNQLMYSDNPDETLTVTYDVRDTPVGRHHNYSTSAILTHPASNIRVQAIAHLGASYRSKTAGLLFKYQKANGVDSQIHLLGELDTHTNQGKLMISTPIKRVDILGGLTKDRYGYKITQETIFDGSNRVWWSLDLNARNKSVALDLHYDNANPTKMFRLVGWLQAHEMMVQALHSQGSESEIYGLVSARLNSTRVLHTRLHWKPSLLTELKVASNNRLVAVNNEIRNQIETVRTALDTELTERQSKMSRPDVSRITNAIQQEAVVFRADVDTVLARLEEMFANNEFFMKATAETVTLVSEYLNERTRVARIEMRRAWADYQRRLQQRLASLRRQVDQYLARLEEQVAAIVLKFRPSWQSYAYAAIRSVKNNHQNVAQGWEQLQERAAEHRAAIVRFFDDRFDYISYKMEPFVNHWISLPDNIFSAEEKTYFIRLRKKIVAFFEKIRTRWEEMYARVHDKMLILRDRVQEKLNEINARIMEYEVARIAVTYARKAYSDIADAWEEWEVPKTLCRIATTLYNESKVYVKEYLRRTLQKYMRMENTGITLYDPANGEIQAAVYLPLEIEQLNKMPKINWESAKQALLRLKGKYTPQTDFSIWDAYYKYKPSSNPLDWIPPFKAHAMLALGKHFTTFDGLHYDFAGTCSYVLARDFIDHNFTVVANYREGLISSITVVTNGKNVEVFADYKVTIDDHRQELPIQFENTTITRDGYRIRVHNTKGITVQCDLYNKICTANITGWYYGKTAGLFGTYNNEQDDEMMTADRRTVTDVAEFTRSWEIGSDCRGSRNLARHMPTTSNPEITEACERYFKAQDSLFRPCFGQVAPQTYLDMCISDVQQDYSQRTVLEKVCAIAAAYITECRLNRVDLSQDSQCMKCQDANDASYRGTITVRSADIREKKADVVLIVEEKACNRETVGRLESIVNIIDNSLKAQGVSNNQFAVLGFGGNGVHDQVHHHTMEGQLFNEARKIRAAIRSLDLQSDGDNTDVMGAIYQASRLGFRAGASKSIVVIPCSSCEQISIGYAALRQVLQESSIQLHVLADHDFTLRTDSPKTNYIFGIDSDAAFTMYHVNQQDLRGDSILHRQVVMPKSLCSALAVSQNGSIFNRQKLTEGRTKAQKSFIDIFARRVAKTAAPTECQICDCVTDADGVGKSVCRSCEMPTYNSFFKKFFPSIYNHNPDQSYTGDKAEIIPIPIPSPRDLNYAEVAQS